VIKNLQACQQWLQLKMRPIQAPEQQSVDDVIGKALVWTNRFNQDFAGADDDGGQLALDYAWRKYDQVERDKALIGAKEEHLLQASGVIAAGQVGLLNFTTIAPSAWLLVSLGMMLICVILLVFGRRTRSKPALMPISDVLNGLQHAQQKRWWIAAALHPVVEAQLPHAHYQMRINALATYIFCGGLLCLIPLAYSQPALSGRSAVPSAVAVQVEAAVTREPGVPADAEVEQDGALHSSEPPAD
jgi:hypothetical protein